MTSEEYTINMADVCIEVRRKKIKSMRLAVHPPQGRVTLSVPWQVSDADIYHMVLPKLRWIREQQAAMQQQEYDEPAQYIGGERHHYRGRSYILDIIERRGHPKVVLQPESILCLHVRPGSTTACREMVLENWYRQQLKTLMPTLLARWQPILGKEINDWGIKKMKTRWGSCNIVAKRIWLNLELIKYPLATIEYVLVHELVHLHERYHNARFKQLMDQFLPDWRKREVVLKAGLTL